MKVILIIPYFGKFPTYFDYFLKSAYYNSNFDFCFITDIQSEKYKSKNNVKFVNTTFEDLRNKIQVNFDFKVNVDDAYKLCDYRPAYGIIFSDLVKDYDFWGHCDTDIIMGDINKFITPETLEKYDRISNVGHFCLYRNTEKMNNLYKCPGYGYEYTYKEAFTSPSTCSFDEFLGINLISRFNNINIYSDLSEHVADINPQNYRFMRYGRSNVFTWENGKLFGHHIEENQVIRKEYFYVHFQKRPMECDELPIDCNRFIMIPNRFICENEQITPDFINQIESKKHYYFTFWINRKLKNARRLIKKVGIKELIRAKRKHKYIEDIVVGKKEYHPKSNK